MCEPATVLSSSRSVAARSPSAVGAKRTLIEQDPPGATPTPVQPSDDLMKSSGLAPPKSARRTRSTSCPAFVTVNVATYGLIVPIPRCPKSATSPENCASGHGVVLSRTDTLLAPVAELAARKSGLPSPSKSPTATALGPSAVAQGPSTFVEVRPPSSSPRKTRAVAADLRAARGSGTGLVAERRPHMGRR